MFKRIKPISKTSLEGIIYQIRYLINEKNASDRTLVYRLSKILSDYGIPTECISTPPPDWTAKP
jgi:hypothetical protein